MQRILRQVLISYLIAFLLAGCGPRQPTARCRIAVIPKGTTHDFWKSIHAALSRRPRSAAACKSSGKARRRRTIRQEQQNIVERFTSEGVSAIVLAPCDKQSLAAPVEAALKKGIPVVIIDSGVAETPAIKDSPKYLGYVATDNVRGGTLAAAGASANAQGQEGGQSDDAALPGGVE